MSDEFPGDDSTSTSFETWLDQQAENQGMTREELFEQLVSSYWTLKEMSQLLDDSGGANTPIRGENLSRENEGQSAGNSGGNGSKAGTPMENPDRRRGDLPAERRDGSEDRPGPDATPATSDLEDRFEDLEEQVEELEADLETELEHGRTLDQLFDALAERLTEVESELDEVASTAESTEATLTERIERLESDLTDRQEALENEHEQVEEWLNAEFDSLRTILEYLIDRTDDLERDIANAGSRQEREIERLRAEREALQSIKRDAADHDAHEGQCENCEETIDLDLLTRPYCPHCDASLTGVETESRFWIFTDTIVTARDADSDGDRSGSSVGKGSAPLPSRGRERERGPTTAPPADTRTDSSDGLDGRAELDRTAAGRPSESLDLETPFGEQSESTRGSESSGGDDGSSGFEFNGTSDSVSGGSTSDESEPSGEAKQSDSPFGDLEDLRREEDGGSER